MVKLLQRLNLKEDLENFERKFTKEKYFDLENIKSDKTLILVTTEFWFYIRK